jgi:hypothetical protein
MPIEIGVVTLNVPVPVPDTVVATVESTLTCEPGRNFDPLGAMMVIVPVEAANAPLELVVAVNNHDASWEGRRVSALMLTSTRECPPFKPMNSA